MPPRASSRSKSPAKSKAAKAFDPMDYLDEAIALGLCLGLASAAGLSPTDPSSLGSLMTGGGAKLPVIGQSTVLTLHTLNICQGRGKKFWLTDIMECVAGVFAAGIALALLNGGSLGDALMGGDESQYTFVIICWYLQNHSIAGAVPNVWDMITASPVGAPLQRAMSLATTCFVNSVIMEAAAGVTASPLNLSTVAITPLIKAALVAGATSAIPAKPAQGAATSSAMVIAVLISTNGLTSLPVVGDTIGTLTATVTAAVPIGDSISAIYTNLVIVNAFFGGMIAALGVPSELTNPAPVVAGLVNQVLNLKA
jgi:hypothetical protein